VVIEEIEAPDLEGTVVRAIPGADAAVVGHDVQPVFAVNGRVYRANRFARRVFAVLAHHRFVHDLGVLRILALVLVEGLLARVIAVEPQPMHGPAVAHLEFAHDWNVVFALAGNNAGAATGADIEVYRHAPLLFGGQRR